MASRYRGYGGHTVERLTEVGWEALPLEPSLKVNNHSPTGFSWGYLGSGPSQLALAILLDATQAGTRGAIEVTGVYQQFKTEVVAGWPIDGTWEISADEVFDWLAQCGGPIRPLMYD
jgi:hypothetical protein